MEFMFWDNLGIVTCHMLFMIYHIVYIIDCLLSVLFLLFAPVAYIFLKLSPRRLPLTRELLKSIVFTTKYAISSGGRLSSRPRPRKLPVAFTDGTYPPLTLKELAVESSSPSPRSELLAGPATPRPELGPGQFESAVGHPSSSTPSLRRLG